VLVQVETPLALSNIESIAAVDGVDGIFIGPGDLSASMGHLGNPKHPEVVAAIEDAVRRNCATGKAAGILSGDEAIARRCIDLGCTFVAVGSDIGIWRAAPKAWPQNSSRPREAAVRPVNQGVTI
jgi:4-hydroxy-2-oxoheptanedioate aldolase